MLPLHAMPVLLTVLVALLLGLLGWSVAREHRPRQGTRPMETRDGLLLGLLALAAFCFGIFLTYLILSIAI